MFFFQLLYASILFILYKAIQIFNYKIIDTKSLKAGMIISVLSLQEIREICTNRDDISYLGAISEDMKNRISEEEAILLKGLGIDKIRIVRKIPFAFFASVSCLLYLIIGGYYAF